MEKKIKKKKCRICKSEFLPGNSLQVVCGYECAIELAKKKRIQKEKKEAAELRKWKREKKEEMMTASDWRNKLQEVFNQYIRERDRGLPCVSCQNEMGDHYHAGHLYSVGRFPELRFSELNVHGQCHHCNLHLHGNGAMYRKNIIERIGEDGLQLLDSKINIMNHYSIPELKEMIKDYRMRIRKIKKDRD